MTIVEKGSAQVRYAFPAYRVFIFGEEVTLDVLDINIQNNIGRAPNTCTVTLANDLDKYILTTDEFKAIYGFNLNYEIKEEDLFLGIDQTYGEIKEKYAEPKIKENISKIQTDLKRNILLKKSLKRIEDVKQPDISGKIDATNIYNLTGTAYRYPFQAEDPIFHANDPIRVFWRDPYDPIKWYHMFAGFLSNFDDSVDENLQKTLTITAEGPSKILRYARITTNPGITDIESIKQSELDAALRSAYSEGFSGLTLPEFIFSLIFGNDPEDTSGQQLNLSRGVAQTPGDTIRRVKLKGVGNFNYTGSIVLEFGPRDKTVKNTFEVDEEVSNIKTDNVESLSIYQSIIDHEVKESDLIEMALDDEEAKISITTDIQNIAKDSNKHILTTEIITYIGKNIELYPVDGGRLIMLVPKSLHQEINRNILLKDVISSFAMTTEFKSRLGMIYDVIERIEFLFYESPKGDLICEFPLYDFNPDDFGNDTIPHYSTFGTYGKYSVNNISRGPFGPRYKIAKRDTYNFSKGITDEKIRTQMAGFWHYLQNYTNEATSKGVQQPAVVTLRHLVPLYWLRLEQVDPKGYIASKEAALLYVQILLNKTNADARNLGINAAPNICLWLNRPIFFAPRNCIGVLMGLGHDIKWGMGGSMNTRINLNYIRGWDGLISNRTDANGQRKMIYTPIGGFPSRPLNYKLLFRIKDTDQGSAELPTDGFE